MLINITANGYISIWEHIEESDTVFKRLYIDYPLSEAKKLFKRELKELKNGAKRK